MIAKLKPGEITEPIAREGRLSDLQAGCPVAPKRSSRSTRSATRSRRRSTTERLDGETQKFLDETAWNQALIEWKDEAYKKLYDKGVAARAGKE